MELISKMLFWVANSLLIPDVIILLLLFARALILIGGTYNMYIAKRKNDRAFDALVKEAYGFAPDLSDAQILSRLFALYQKRIKELEQSEAAPVSDKAKTKAK